MVENGVWLESMAFQVATGKAEISPAPANHVEQIYHP